MAVIFIPLASQPPSDTEPHFVAFLSPPRLPILIRIICTARLPTFLPYAPFSFTFVKLRLFSFYALQFCAVSLYPLEFFIFIT
jgi:hypothetical protein